MRTLGILHLGLVFLLLPACGDSGGDDNVSWSASFTGEEGDSDSAGGAVVDFSSNLEVEEASWILDEAVPFDGLLPLPDLAAMGDALARTDWEVLDAVFTPEGTVALLDGGDGPVLRLLSDGPLSLTTLPPKASRLLLTEEHPIRILVVIGRDAAIPAIRYTPVTRDE